MITKEDYLAVATPEEWDIWLTTQASVRSPKNRLALKRKIDNYIRDEHCLFCKVAEKASEGLPIAKCVFCMKDRDQIHCSQILIEEKVDQAIERLEAIGLWD